MENKLYERDFKNGQLYGVGILYFENGNKNIDQILNMIILQGQEYFMIKEEIKKKQRKK